MTIKRVSVERSAGQPVCGHDLCGRCGRGDREIREKYRDDRAALPSHGGQSEARQRTFPSMVSEKLVEVRELAHEIVKAAAGGGELAQREPAERGRRHRPQQQGQMREIAAFGENADKISHYFSSRS